MYTNADLASILYELNPWWQNPAFRHQFRLRKSYQSLVSSESQNIDILIGARRVGKTSIMKTVINHLLDDDVSPEQIIYFTTDARISPHLVPEDLTNFLKTTFKLKASQKIYLFLDEVQDLPNWQRGIKYLYDNTNIKIYLTGSSSLILKPQTSKLTGRFILHEILGLSFTEYLEFTQSKPSSLELYLQTGGYPEYVLNQEKQALSNIIESTLYRDLISEYGIRNPAFLKDLLDYLADKVTTPVSNQRIAKDLKVNDDTAKFYLKYLQDVYLIYPVYRQSRSHKISKSSVPKYYFNDTGVLNLRSLSPKIGLLAENAVYLHLRRKAPSKEYADINYHVTDGIEIDFTNRQNRLTEVKYRDNLSVDDLTKYQTVDRQINFVIKNHSEIFNDILPMHTTITLDQFLLS